MTEKRPVQVDAMVVLPDYIHAIWTLADDDLHQHIDCIHYNPVKHGPVVRVQDWEYSTFLSYVKLGIYTPSWWAMKV